MITRKQFLSAVSAAAAYTVTDWDRLFAMGEKTDIKNDYPTVVIGAGLGGLTCAAYLAKAGFHVTVVEKYPVVGGYATTFERGNFEFDISLHAISARDNATYLILQELSILDKIELVPLKQSHRIISPGRDYTLPDCDPHAFTELLSSHYPSEKKGIKSFVQKITAVSDEANALFKKKDFWKFIFPLQYSAMWSVRDMTLSQLLDEHTMNTEARDALSYLCGYYGLPPSSLSAFYYAVATGDYLKNGSYYIKSKSKGLSEALAQVITDHGGTIITGTSAVSILTENDRVKTVITDGGDKIPARIVVCNANTPECISKMLVTDTDISGYKQKISAYRPSISSFIVWLGLKKEISEKIPGCSIMVKPEGNLEDSFKHMHNCDAGKTGYSVTIYDNYFKGYSKPGKSTITAMFLSGYEPWRKFEKDYMNGKKKEYYAEKARVTETLIKRIEKTIIPGLSSMIEVKESATPLTNVSYTGNPDGAIYGYESSIDNCFINRIENRTPVKGLYLAGAWGNPGGGYTGVMRSGNDTFRAIIDDID